MALNVYDMGDLVRISSGTFTNSGGTAVDPTTITMRLRNPAGSVITYVSGGTPAPSQAATGSYFVDVTLTMPGRWHYRWEGVGDAVAAAEGSLEVQRSRVL